MDRQLNRLEKGILGFGITVVLGYVVSATFYEWASNYHTPLEKDLHAMSSKLHQARREACEFLEYQREGCAEFLPSNSSRGTK